MKVRSFEIFRAGNHTTSNGAKLSFNEVDLQRMATAYNSVTPSRASRAPLVIGHPSDERDVHTYGEIESLSVRGASLFARSSVEPTLIGAVRHGLYKNRSAAFYGPRHRANPVPGAYFLRHVGFLGAQPPAVKGMAPLEFSEKVMASFSDSDAVTFSEGCIDADFDLEDAFFSSGVNYDQERLDLHFRALRCAKEKGIDYGTAVRQLIEKARA